MSSGAPEYAVVDTVLEVAGLHRMFDDFDVFGTLSFQVDSGQAVALVGPNGSGKSTVLRCVAGIETPSSGVSRIVGEVADERSATVRASMAVVIDDLDFFPDLSVCEHLDLLARAHRVEEPEALVDAILDDVGLSMHSGQLPGTLSSGQLRRLALATAFVRPRRLLVLDEPEQRLDQSGLKWLAGRLNGEKDAGLAVLFASHDPALVEAVADTVIDLGETR